VPHNSLLLVAHFHNVFIRGAPFGAFAGHIYWFSKPCGFNLDEGLGQAAFWCWRPGLYAAFMPHLVLLGKTRNEACMLCLVAGHWRVTRPQDGNEPVRMLLAKSLS
jgi:heme/copper-type cytochrome/quinol oxidase subunit 1